MLGRHHLTLALLSLTALHCAEHSESADATSSELRVELSGAASGITVYVRPELDVAPNGVVTLFGRASKDLAAVSASMDGQALGTVSLPSYRTPALVFDGPALGSAGVTALLGGTSGERRLSAFVPVPGDESVNGEWRLVIDTTAEPRNLAGDRSVVSAVLTLSSRYD